MSLTVREWRRAKEISQEKMAEVLGVHVNTYISWETDPSKIKIGDAYKIAEFLGVPIEGISFLPTTLHNVEN